MERSRRVRPRRRRKALGRSAPMRTPLPAATMMARTVMRDARPGGPGRIPPGTVRVSGRAAPSRPGPSDLEDLFFLVLRQLVDLVDVEIGLLLHLVQPALLVILGDRLVLEELLQRLVGVPALQPDRRPPVLGDLVHTLRELLAALFRERGDGDA